MIFNKSDKLLRDKMPVSDLMRKKIIKWVEEKVPYSKIMERVKNAGETISKGGITYIKSNYGNKKKNKAKKEGSISFVGKISSSGENKQICIPKNKHDLIDEDDKYYEICLVPIRLDKIQDKNYNKKELKNSLTSTKSSIKPNDNNIYYFEYIDHGKIYQDPKTVFKNPLTLWCVGKIAEETKDLMAVVCSGVKDRNPSSQPSYEIIVKSAITKKKLIYQIN